MGCNKPHKKSNDFRPVWIAPTEKFVYKISTYIHLCRNWKPIITSANWIKRFMTFGKKLNSFVTCTKSNHWYFRAQPPAYPCSIKIEATIRTKRSNSYISSRKVFKFVYLRKNSNNCAKYGLQTWLTPTETIIVLTLHIQPIRDK